MDLTIITAIGIILIVLVVLAIIISTSIKKRNRLAFLDKLENRNSTLKALPVNYLLNKVSLMPKSSDVEKQYSEWAKTYDRLTEQDAVKIKDDLNEIESLIFSRRYKRAKDLLESLDQLVTLHEKEYEELLNDLTKATQVDVKNREEITNQKELFRNYRKMHQSNYDNYKPYNLAIERYFTNIEDSFTNIDVLLNQSQVDKARNKAASLEGELLKMKDILNNLPAILEELTKDLPSKYKDVEYRYNEIVGKKYNLDNLEIPKRLGKVNTEIVTVLSQNNDVFIKDLQDTSHLVHQELDNIMQELDNEVRANEELDKVITNLVEESLIADKKCKQANKELNDIKEHYILVKNEEANLLMETKVLFNFLVKKNEIVSTHMSNNYVASSLENKASNLLPKIKAVSVALEAYLNRLANIRADEKRLFDEYNNMLYLIKDCESRLSLVNLPILSQSYYDTISECKQGLNEVLILLNDKPINIDLINSKVATVCDIVYKLYDNSRNLLKTAQMAENTIVFGNRYRSSRPEIDSMLNRAEVFFNNGEYTKSLSTAIEAIETIYPSIRKELLKYKTNQLQNNSYL